MIPITIAAFLVSSAPAAQALLDQPWVADKDELSKLLASTVNPGAAPAGNIYRRLKILRQCQRTFASPCRPPLPGAT